MLKGISAVISPELIKILEERRNQGLKRETHHPVGAQSAKENHAGRFALLHAMIFREVRFEWPKKYS